MRYKNNRILRYILILLVVLAYNKACFVEAPRGPRTPGGEPLPLDKQPALLLAGLA